MINIDFLLAGCNTRCMHCYVAGGKLNPFETAALYDTKKYPPASAGTNFIGSGRKSGWL